MISALFGSESWTASLVNHLWQSSGLLAVAWLLGLVLRENSAQVRYRLWLAASVKFLLPISLLTAAGAWLRSRVPAEVPHPAVAGMVEEVAQPFARGQPVGAPGLAFGTPHHAHWAPLIPALIWALGALLVAARFARGWRLVYSLKRAARPMEIDAEVPVLCTRGSTEPGIFGILRPVLLLPEGILGRLSPGQLHAVIAHEMCHVRRRDNLTYAIHRRLGPARRTLLAGAGALAVTAPLLLGLVCGSAQSQSTPSTAAPARSFEVASIRPAPDRTGQAYWVGERLTGDMFEAHGVPLELLVSSAYFDDGPRPEKVAGAAGWMESETWDIVARFDDPSGAGLSNRERMRRIRPMLQALLVERFHLKVHSELRPTPVYALVVARGGPRVKEVPAPPEVEGDWTEAMKRFREENPGKPFPGMWTCADDRCTATAVTIRALLGQIQGNSHADRILVDETGLKGHYDLSFRSPRKEDDDAMGEIEEDLGMRFEPRKVDLTTWVIDSAERPSAN